MNLEFYRSAYQIELTLSRELKTPWQRDPLSPLLVHTSMIEIIRLSLSVYITHGSLLKVNLLEGKSHDLGLSVSLGPHPRPDTWQLPTITEWMDGCVGPSSTEHAHSPPWVVEQSRHQLPKDPPRLIYPVKRGTLSEILKCQGMCIILNKTRNVYFWSPGYPYSNSNTE